MSMTRFLTDVLARSGAVAGVIAILVTNVNEASADGCLVLASGEPWDRLNQTVEVQSMTVMTVVRFDSTQRRGTVGAKRQSWTDDVPSDALGAQAICDRVQLESAYPLMGEQDLPITMLQGEWLSPSVDLTAFPDLKSRLEADGRLVTTKPGPAYLAAVDLEAPNWRPDLFAEVAQIGDVDESRWMIALPGGLHIVPLLP